MKTKDLLILGGVAIGGYFLYNMLKKTPQAQAVEGAAGGAVSGFTGLSNAGLDILYGYNKAIFDYLGSAIQGLQEAVSNMAQTHQITPVNAPISTPSNFQGTPVVTASAASAIRYPTSVITAFETPQKTVSPNLTGTAGAQATPITSRTPYGYSATNSKGQVIATGFTSLAAAKAYEVAVNARKAN